jgi:hypothetical protein
VYSLAIFVGDIVVDNFDGIFGEELLDLKKITLLFRHYLYQFNYK